MVVETEDNRGDCDVYSTASGFKTGEGEDAEKRLEYLVYVRLLNIETPHLKLLAL